MRKLITALLCTMVLFCTVFSLGAFALPGDDQKGDITITYKAGDVVFPEIEVNAYYLAEMSGYGVFVPASPFDNYPINLNNVSTQQEWDDLATTIGGYIVADNLMSDCMIITNEDGVVVMDYMEPGLYFITGVTAQSGITTYNFKPCFVWIPRYENNQWIYEASIQPKWSSYTPQTEYSVVKLWKDSDKTDKRPQQVEVEIYNNGDLKYTEILNSDNSWTFAWQADDDGSMWTVVEKNVPKGYTVSVTEQNGVFSIVNKYKSGGGKDPTPTPTPPTNIKVPNTGDNSNFTLYATLMCISGLLLLILGVYRNRRNNEES